MLCVGPNHQSQSVIARILSGCLFRIPHPPEESLLLGSALIMRRKDHHRSLRAWARQLGGVYAIRIGLQHVRACRWHLPCMSHPHRPAACAPILDLSAGMLIEGCTASVCMHDYHNAPRRVHH
jgi:hypothetical protein